MGGVVGEGVGAKRRIGACGLWDKVVGCGRENAPPWAWKAIGRGLPDLPRERISLPGARTWGRWACPPSAGRRGVRRKRWKN